MSKPPYSLFHFFMIGSDHAGYKAKMKLATYLYSILDEQLGTNVGTDTKKWMVKDFGCKDEGAVDYPDIAHSLCSDLSVERVKLWENIDEREVKEKRMCGILICGTGQGMAMAANKYSNVRAALCWDEQIATLARAHNDANILCLPAYFVGTRKTKSILRAFISTPFEGGRHKKRVNKITASDQ